MRGFDAFLRAYEKGVLIRTTGDTIALSPSFIIEKGQIDQLFETVRDILKTLALNTLATTEDAKARGSQRKRPSSRSPR